MKNVHDHLGNKFATIKEMCGYWHITYGAYKERTRHNWPLDKKLTTPIRKKQNIESTDKNLDVPKSFTEMFKENKPIDHLGNEFKSIKEMCNYWKIPYSTYISRRNHSGWSVEDALTIKPGIIKRKVIDHTGKEFESIKDACTTWHIHRDTYTERTKSKQCPEQEIFIRPIFAPKIGDTTTRKYHGHKEYYEKTPTGMKRKAIIEWEKHNGPMPDNHSIVFIDNNAMHYQINNIDCIPLSTRAEYNILKHQFANIDLNPIALDVAKINTTIKKISSKLSQP